ncbi:MULTISPECIES: hypothetical protein [unclassified Vibrio]|nr:MULTISPECIES: hypothetical protein [unclassified Vibrio]PMK73886.1 hypothetical protein BCT92_24070 [Vibrio sp. 10N.261.52.E5]TKF77162.1 hypothetical protein FCV65_24560 [Vibrio sp. F13]
MIKVKYVLDGTKGELELTKLTGFDSKEAVLVAHGAERISNSLDEELLVDVMAVLKPAIDPLASPAVNGASSEPRQRAEKFGFTTLQGHIEDNVIMVL